MQERLQAALGSTYRIERELGAGGMATVYLARDVRHNRQVALKVLNAELSAVLGPERFLKEIELTANLQHPHILPLFDSGEAAGQLFYVMPYVEGETLRARLAREQQLPLGDALRIAREVSDALQYAHERGVVHRDIKPENILLQGGHALVADFGIALAVQQAGGPRMTQTGLSLGTPQYMSPEQAMGEKLIDARSDVYALGAVTYEMLAGEPPFTGPTAQAIIAKMMATAPVPLRAVRPSVPEHVESAVTGALAKLPADRFPSARAFTDALRLTDSGALPTVARAAARVSPPRASWPTVLPWALAAMLALTTSWALWRAPEQTSQAEAPVIRTSFGLGDGERIWEDEPGTFAISPAGDVLAYVVRGAAGVRTVMRRTDELTPRVIAEVGMRSLVFSPDGQWLAFRDGIEIRRVRVDGGSSEVVTRIPAEILGGMAWIRGDTLVIGSSAGGLFAVPASGGTLRPWAVTDSVFRRVAHPVALSDGKTLLFWTGRGSVRGALALDLTTHAYTVLDARPNVIPVGYLDGHALVASPGTQQLLAIPFDLRTRQVGGEGFAVAENVSAGAVSGARVALSWSGTMLQLVNRDRQRIVRVRDAGGVEELLPPVVDAYYAPRLSPDGRQLAYELRGRIYVRDLSVGTQGLLSGGYRHEWMPDGRRILHLVQGQRTIIVTHADGTRRDTVFVAPMGVNEVQMLPGSGGLLYRTAVEEVSARSDIFFVPLNPTGEPVPLVTGPAQDNMMRVSPDGRWVAYQTDVSGRFETYVTPAQRPGPRTPVTSDGGSEPSWSSSGRDLYYRLGSALMRVPVANGDAVAIGRAQRMLAIPDYAQQSSVRNYDVASDGRSVVYVQLMAEQSDAIIVHQWVRELRRRLAERAAPE